MKPLVAIVCMMFAAFAFGAEKKPEPKKTSITESELRTMAKAKPNAKDAGTLYQVGMATNNVERKQEFFKASAACLLACGKDDTYRKHIRSKLTDAKAFEDSLKDKCKQCGGAGRKDRKCYVCSGNGRCSTCKGSGQTVSVEFDRPNGTKPCHKCRGSGECNKCGGAGSTQEKCGSCAGTGTVFRESVAERVFRDTCIAIADRHAAEARAKAEEAERERKRIAEEKKGKEEAAERERKRIADAKKAEERKRKRIAEANGDANELFKKGLAHYLGVDVQDFSLAIEYFSDAAELGCIRADAALALMYFEGQGCELNEQRLTKCFIHAKKVAACGDEAMSESAKNTLGKLYIAGFYDEEGRFQRDASKAYHYFSSCEINGEGLLIKGIMEYYGLGTVKDTAKAVETLVRLQVCKDATYRGRALMCLGYMLYVEGENYNLAWKWLCDGTREAFPKLIQAIRSPLTEKDKATHMNYLLGGGSSSWTALNLKMALMCQDIGKANWCGRDIDIINKALMTLFNPDCWKGTGVQYDFISGLAGANK